MKYLAPLLFALLPGFAAAQPVKSLPSVGVSGADILSMLGGLGLVLLCLFGLASLLRRSRLASSPCESGVSVIAQLPVNIKEKLLVVQVGEQRLLLGCTPGCIRTLHSWSADAPPPATAPNSFASLMGAALKKAARGEKVS